jgi:hypothetical protein
VRTLNWIQAMRKVMVAGGIETFVSVLEGDLLEAWDLKEDNYVYADQLDERELVLALGLLRKGVLEREYDEKADRQYFIRNINRGEN